MLSNPTSQVYDAIGTEQAAALPALYALSGSDNTNTFAGKGKRSFWEAFQFANGSTLTALASLGTNHQLHDSTFAAIEEFVCKVYDSQT